ncbi:MAG: hypothetical protein ACK5O2_07250 [Microthrixaceae bacterium]
MLVLTAFAALAAVAACSSDSEPQSLGEETSSSGDSDDAGPRGWPEEWCKLIGPGEVAAGDCPKPDEDALVPGETPPASGTWLEADIIGSNRTKVKYTGETDYTVSISGYRMTLTDVGDDFAVRIEVVDPDMARKNACFGKDVEVVQMMVKAQVLGSTIGITTNANGVRAESYLPLDVLGLDRARGTVPNKMQVGWRYSPVAYVYAECTRS